VLSLDQKRTLFVGGKGGVGKTTTAAALALYQAERGRRCLLVSTDPAHSLGDLFGRSIGAREQQLGAKLWGVEIDPESEVDRHLDAIRQSMRGFVHPEFYPEIDRHMALARLSPGAVEAAMMERIADILAEGRERYDLVLFDTAPTGHTLRLMALPEIMIAWTEGLLGRRERADAWAGTLKQLSDPRPAGEHDPGDHRAQESDRRSLQIREALLARQRKFQRVRRLLLDESTTAFLLVLIPEKLPILETRKALEALQSAGVPIAGIVVNRVLPPGPLGEFLEDRRAQEGRYLGEIDRHFGALPQVRIPLLPWDVEGPDALREVGRRLVAGG
jgi:arsenite-transporting ATPase